MFHTGSATSVEADADPPLEVTDKITLAKLLHGLSSVYEKLLNLTVGMETRRYRDPREHDPDYSRHLRELEGDIRAHEPRFRMGDYHEGGGGKWDKWAMPGLVTLAVTGIIGNVVQSMTVSALRQEVTDLKAQVERIDRLVEPRFRGG